ncbi:MAG: hypothetical protein JSS08_01205 [Proteobacteria bacterium]|nr:hypothetical protein [Pseudomonadota bacterium]
MAHEIKRLSAAEFEALRHLMTNVGTAQIDAARLVLVDEMGYQEAGDAIGISRQTVWKAVKGMMETWERYCEARSLEEAAQMRKLPRGWKRATITAPAAVIDRCLAEAEAAHLARLKQLTLAEAALLAQAEKKPGR